ncbi:hypothetical protein [Novosphingobium mangrovi (ex Huang et al. 2023)]|uniref:Uncharacterized protein n=1 Tax=Novosphingobium mangrovi (ex Huang et al. 2023) TaxID=2976432 RepID=A0ABT2I3F8_9SPHN|nr:hypothetical protein [Novosphingobium mangrovi (ex Huang et al. 2023)]MCT2399325.1 hypothetical protein [Novosphingobium mangrovi (ex Huang et al. 2023)]
MKEFWKIFNRTLAVIATLSLAIIAFKAIHGLIHSAPPGQPPRVDYNTIVIVLLTTVTVIFSVCAIALGILGAIGFRNLKKDAGKFAEVQAINEIKSAFEKNGTALNHIDSEFQREDGHFRPWMKERIRKEIVLLLPLIMTSKPPSTLDENLAEGEPTDEGETD